MWVRVHSKLKPNSLSFPISALLCAVVFCAESWNSACNFIRNPILPSNLYGENKKPTSDRSEPTSIQRTQSASAQVPCVNQFSFFTRSQSWRSFQRAYGFVRAHNDMTHFHIVLSVRTHSYIRAYTKRHAYVLYLKLSVHTFLPGGFVRTTANLSVHSS